MLYQGYDSEKKQWEQFECDRPEDATPEATGYDKVEPLNQNSFMEEVTLLPHEIQLIEKCIAWSAQQGYTSAEETAKAFGRLTGKEMYEDQPYYNAFAWRKIK